MIQFTLSFIDPLFRPRVPARPGWTKISTSGGNQMIVKRGSVVSHAMAQQWGTGKVVEVDDVRATIRFNDGMVRKIISSHFTDLRPADPASYHPPVKAQKAKGKATSRTARPKTPKKKPAITAITG